MFPFGKDWKKPWRAGEPVALDQLSGVLGCIPGPSLDFWGQLLLVQLWGHGLIKSGP